MNIAIIGGGPAGIMAGIWAKKTNPSTNITIFEKSLPLKTLLYTGGGRCNLTYAEFDFKVLASYYPRGEKFLYSVFSQFDVSSVFDFYEKNGLPLYIQKDNRVFPKSNSASDVRDKLLQISKNQNIKILSNCTIIDIIAENEKYKVVSREGSKWFDRVIISTGGRYKGSKNNGFEFAKSLGHTVSALSPALCGFMTKEKFVRDLAGLTLKNIKTDIYSNDKKILELQDDFLFTHSGISGPLAFKISSLCDFSNISENNPIILKLNLCDMEKETFDKELIKTLAIHSKRNIDNVLSEFIPFSLARKILEEAKIEYDKKSYEINSAERKRIVELMTEFNLSLISQDEGGEMVTKGGVCLDEVNPKTMESKIKKGLFFCGEVLNIDGLTGGFNLQSCWSTGAVAGMNAGKENN